MAVKKKDWKGKILPEHHIEFAFNDGVEDNWNFSDAFNIPAERALDALTVYEEMNMRCTRDFLLAHTAAVKNILRSNPVDIFKINELNTQLEERLAFIVYPKLIMKLASVYYFDKTENPYRYDAKYAETKIARWEKNGINDFFLSKPIKNLMPSYELSGIDLETFSQVTEKIDRSHLASIFTNLSPDQRRSDIFSQLLSTNASAKTTASA